MAKVKEADQKEIGVDAPNYSDKEIVYLSKIMNQMVLARNIRETPHDEFDGMTYIQRCESNRKLANTFIQPKKNRQDSNYQSGTVRQKLLAYLSYLNNLSIEAEIHAFDDKSVEDVGLGNSLSDIIQDASIKDKDPEKQLNRQYVLLEQGEVFVEEVWDEYFEIVKDLTTPFDGSNFDKVTWTEKSVKQVKGPTRNVLLNENVYLGDITVFEFEEQPFIFTVEQVDYETAKQRYGTWARWGNVPKTVKFLTQPIPASMYNQNFSLTDVQKNQCEIVKYQCKTANEFAIIINGVLMTPVGVPIPRKWGPEGNSVRYNVTQQICGIISPYFAYGKGVCATLKTKAYILDEMNRLAILKTQQSFQPARWNLTGTVLSSRMFMPGQVANGVDGTKIGNLTDANGINRSELQMIQYLQKGIDDDAAPAAALSSSGGAAGSRVSATQIQTMKSQAEMMMVLTLFAATTLEIKLGTLRLYNVLENHFEAIDYSFNEVEKKLEEKYRSITVDKVIPGYGPGQSVVEVSNKDMTKQEIDQRRAEIERRTGKPTTLSVINANVLKTVNRCFYVTALPKPKKNSDLTKIVFNEMLQQALQFPNLDMDYMGERFATVWGEDPTKMFKSGQGAGDAAGALPPGSGRNGARGKMLNKNMTRAGKPGAQMMEQPTQ